MQAITISRKDMFLYHLTTDYPGFGILATIILTIPIQEIGATVPIISGALVLLGQGVKWYVDNKRKQERHKLFLDIGNKMLAGELKFDKEFLENLNKD
jgi:hypothetical protein